MPAHPDGGQRPVDQHHPGPGASEVVGHGGSDHAGTHDDHVHHVSILPRMRQSTSAAPASSYWPPASALPTRALQSRPRQTAWVFELRTERLTMRPMTHGDLGDIAALLGDPVVMRCYPAPKTREQARAWIAWNLRTYDRHGFGPWAVRTRHGQFVGDCGLTVQDVDGEQEVEVGHHVRAELQGQGLATEAAACRDHATHLGLRRLVAIIDPANSPSQRVATKIGLALGRTVHTGEGPRRICAAALPVTTT